MFTTLVVIAVLWLIFGLFYSNMVCNENDTFGDRLIWVFIGPYVAGKVVVQMFKKEKKAK